MHHYRDYIAEKKGAVVETFDEGFFVWSVINEHAVFIHDVFVKPEHRRKGLLAKWTAHLMSKVPESVKFLFAEVDTKDKCPELSLSALLSYGLKIQEIKDNRYIVCYFKIFRGDGEYV